MSYAHDLDSNRTSLSYPGADGGTLTSAYSAGGRLTTVTDWATRATTYTYTAAGRARTLTLPNGLVTTYIHDRAQRLTRIENTVGATVISDHSYTLDAEGNRTALAEFVSGITTPGGTDSFTLTYDGLNRLTAISGPVAESFSFDPASNITGRTGPSQTNTYDQANRHTSDGTSSYAWSAADRLTARGADTFGYDPLDRLTSSTVAGTALTYAYSGDGLLQSLTQGAATASFLWDLGTAPQRLLQVGDDRLVYGLGPLYAIRSDGTTLTFARDAQKSIRAELNSSGSVTGSFRYRAYGEVAQSSGSGPTFLGYAGQLIDVSGLLYMRARWYDVAAGRLITRDPAPSDTSLPVSHNAFIYAASNPVVFADPTGMVARREEDVTDPVNDPGPIFDEKGGGAGLIAGVVSAAANAAAARSTVVYEVVDTAGKVIYVGIAYSDRFLRRTFEHLQRFGPVVVQRIVEVASRQVARGVEQTLIENLSGLQNKIGSIAASNPIYPWATREGRRILEQMGYGSGR